jgi:hypothetical protein
MSSTYETLQVKAQQGDGSLLVPFATLEATVVPWLIQNERAIERPDYHTLVRAFKAFDPDGHGWIDSQALRASLTVKVCMCTRAPESPHVQRTPRCYTT